jgi:NAD(P)-dependent dehydrogenase (short-subunit alcohol dehydrogenase family)
MAVSGVLAQFDIAGRAAFVTGAAAGLGLAIAETLIAAGANVTLVDRNAELVARQAARLGCGHAVADVTDRAALDNAFVTHLTAHGRLDILFANAGLGGGPGVRTLAGQPDETRSIDHLDYCEWDEVIAVNLTGAFNTVRAGAALMKAHGSGGSIVITSSNAATLNERIVGLPYMPAKAGVSHLARQAALELAERNIRVNSIAPGPFRTDIAGGRMHDPTIRRGWQKLVPLGEVADPEWIKPLALFLASDASRFITGAEIVIDGGMSLGRIG